MSAGGANPSQGAPGDPRAWRRPFLAIAVAVLVVESSMFALDMGPQTMFVAAVVAFVGTCVWCYFSLLTTTAPPQAPSRAVVPQRMVGADRRVRNLRSSILFGRSIGGYTERLRETLVDVIDDQLRFAHGIDRLLDPEAAEAVLGPHLQAFVDDPEAGADVSKTTELARIVTLIEAL